MNMLPAFSQSQDAPSLKFEHYTGERSLNHGEISSIMKDSKGFLWIGTVDGLNRFDGYELKSFRNDPGDSTTICDGWVGAIAEDHNGVIWVATTIAQGLSCYDPITGKFKRYSDNSIYKNVLPASQIRKIFVDQKNQLWLSSDGQGLYHFDPATLKTTVFKHDLLDANSLASDFPSVICAAGDSHLYISTSEGFDLLDMQTGKCKHFKVSSVNDNRQLNVKNFIFKDSKNKLWICSTEGLKMFDPLSEKIIEYRHHDDDPYSISSDNLYAMCESPDGKLWITTIGGGLNLFDRETNKFFHYYPQEENPAAGKGSSFPHDILYDPSGKMWLLEDATVDGFNLLPEKFEVFTHDQGNKNSLTWNQLQYIYQDRHEKVFIATIYGLDVFDPETKSFQLYQPDPVINSWLDNNCVDDIYQDKDDTYWMGVDEHKLISYNPHSHKSTIYGYKEPHHPDSLGIGYIWSIHQDRNGLLWFAGEMHVCSFDPSTNKFKTYLRDPERPDAYFANATARAFETSDGKLILAGTGLAYFDSLHDKISRIIFTDQHNNIDEWDNGNIVSHAVIDSTLYWLATMGQGLFLVDLKTGRSRHFTTHDGLPSDLIWGVLKDDNGNLWLSTNNGLCRFTPPKSLYDENENAVYRTFNTHDGLPVNEFAWNLYCKLNDGTMLLHIRHE